MLALSAASHTFKDAHGFTYTQPIYCSYDSISSRWAKLDFSSLTLENANM